MKNWLPQNKYSAMLIIALVTVSILAIVTIVGSSFAPTTSAAADTSRSCPVVTDKLDRPNSIQFHPIKLVAEPWRGQHNVYAIFALPLKYVNTHGNSQLIVKGFDQPLEVMRANESMYDSPTPEGYFLVVCFFRTRHALWYWFNGQIGDLQDPCNWTLYLFNP